MDRRSFLRTSAIGGAAAASTTLAAPLYAQGNRTLNLVTSVPDGFAIFDDAGQQVANYITEMTDGQITINKHPAGSLVGAFEVFDAVSSGQADMYHSADYYFLNQHRPKAADRHSRFAVASSYRVSTTICQWRVHR